MLGVALYTAGVKKLRSKKLRFGQQWRPFDSILNWRTASDVGNLCPMWLVILKLVQYSVGAALELRYSWSWAVLSLMLCLFLCPKWTRIFASKSNAMMGLHQCRTQIEHLKVLMKRNWWGNNCTCVCTISFNFKFIFSLEIVYGVI